MVWARSSTAFSPNALAIRQDGKCILLHRHDRYTPYLACLCKCSIGPDTNTMSCMQPKQVTDIKNFLAIARRPDAKMARIKKTVLANRNVQTKFKLRCSRYLYTLVVDDAEKAEKLKQSLPPGTCLESDAANMTRYGREGDWRQEAEEVSNSS